VWVFSSVRVLEWGSSVTVKAFHSNSREVLSFDRDAAARRINHKVKNTKSMDDETLDGCSVCGVDYFKSGVHPRYTGKRT